MLGVSALSFDLEEKLNFFQDNHWIKYLEFGVDSLSDLLLLEQQLNKIENNLPQIAFHLPLKTNPVEDIPELMESNYFFVSNIIKEGLKFKPLYFNMHLGHLFQWKYEKNREKYHQLGAEYINKLLTLDDNIMIYIENMYSLTKNKSGDLISFGKTVEEIEGILSGIPSDRVKFCLDVGHSILSGIDFQNADFLKDSLLHYNTNYGQWDEHLGFQVSGYGWDYLSKLSAGGRFKYILLELPCKELESITERELKRSNLC